MSKTIYLVGNWKMNLGVKASRDFITSVRPALNLAKKTKIWVTPSYTALAAVAELLTNSPIQVGAQNVHWKEQGAFTGDLSVGMLREVGCTYALTGHSERRHICGESSVQVAERTIGALTQKFTVILCIGETLDERTSDSTLSVIRGQLKPLVGKIAKEMLPNLILAYEPVWAIGTGKVASLEDIRETTSGIQREWNTLFTSTLPVPPILYGGSVDPTNCKDILSLEMVSGCLVGGASINKEKFEKMIQIAEAL